MAMTRTDQTLYVGGVPVVEYLKLGGYPEPRYLVGLADDQVLVVLASDIEVEFDLDSSSDVSTWSEQDSADQSWDGPVRGLLYVGAAYAVCTILGAALGAVWYFTVGGR